MSNNANESRDPLDKSMYVDSPPAYYVAASAPPLQALAVVIDPTVDLSGPAAVVAFPVNDVGDIADTEARKPLITTKRVLISVAVIVIGVVLAYVGVFIAYPAISSSLKTSPSKSSSNDVVPVSVMSFDMGVQLNNVPSPILDHNSSQALLQASATVLSVPVSQLSIASNNHRLLTNNQGNMYTIDSIIHALLEYTEAVDTLSLYNDMSARASAAQATDSFTQLVTQYATQFNSTLLQSASVGDVQTSNYVVEVIATVPPTVSPTMQPTSTPSRRPTSRPITSPTSRPSSLPSYKPSSYPTSLSESFVNVGSYAVNSGASWSSNPPTYSCIEACAVVFGGVSGQYQCSTVSTYSNRLAYVDGWGNSAHCSVANPASDTYKVGTTYNCGIADCSYSAYVSDHGCSLRNYCFRSYQVFSSVPTPMPSSRPSSLVPTSSPSAAPVNLVYVGVFQVGSGPGWALNPPTYSCVEACAMLYGGLSSLYQCSTVAFAINRLAYADSWGASCSAVADNYKLNTNYDCGSIRCSVSAYVNDHACTNANYCFRDETYAPTSTPSVSPTVSMSPSSSPTITPTSGPSMVPTYPPSSEQTTSPTPLPSLLPSSSPSGTPSIEPTTAPSDVPTLAPTQQPSYPVTPVPSSIPTLAPSAEPTITSAPTSFALVGLYRLSNGPAWSTNPPTYSCVEACAVVFGGVSGQYQCSTVTSSINRMAYLDGWGSSIYCSAPTVDTFKMGTTYNCGSVGCSYSAYVSDHGCNAANYCFRSGSVQTSVPSVYPTAIVSSSPTAVPSRYPTVIPSVFPTVYFPLDDYSLVGGYRVNSGPAWATSPVTYSCIEACAVVFGGVSSQYRCSTQTSTIDRYAYVDGWGSSVYCSGSSRADDTFKLNSNYNCGSTACSYSAYVNDHSCSLTNYCFRTGSVTFPTTLPSFVPTTAPPSTKPTLRPSAAPSMRPTCLPTSIPSFRPTPVPSSRPSGFPVISPTPIPSAKPTSIATFSVSSFVSSLSFNGVAFTYNGATASLVSDANMPYMNSALGGLNQYINQVWSNGYYNSRQNAPAATVLLPYTSPHYYPYTNNWETSWWLNTNGYSQLDILVVSFDAYRLVSSIEAKNYETYANTNAGSLNVYEIVISSSSLTTNLLGSISLVSSSNLLGQLTVNRSVKSLLFLRSGATGWSKLENILLY